MQPFQAQALQPGKYGAEQGLSGVFFSSLLPGF